MNLYEIYQHQVDALKDFLKGQGRDKAEYIRADILGVEVSEMFRYSKHGVVVITGRDEHDNESVLVAHEGHFHAKLTSVKKKSARNQIGYKIDKGADGTLS